MALIRNGLGAMLMLHVSFRRIGSSIGLSPSEEW
jgi:hypothetical protein